MANDTIPTTPEVGMGATYIVGSDRYPYTIISVSDNGRSFVAQEDRATRTDNNGYYTESQDYEYTPNPSGKTVKVTKRVNGRWIPVGEDKDSGSPFGIGYRRRYNDPSF